MEKGDLCYLSDYLRLLNVGWCPVVRDTTDFSSTMFSTVFSGIHEDVLNCIQYLAFIIYTASSAPTFSPRSLQQ